MALIWTAEDTNVLGDELTATLREPKYDDNAGKSVAGVLEIRGERVRLTIEELDDLISVAASLKTRM